MLQALGYGLLAGTASFAGAALVFKLRDKLEPALGLMIAFAAGTLLAVAFLDLLPEATELAGGQVFPAVLGSFIAFYFLEHLLHYHSHHHLEADHLDHHHPVGLMAFIGMGFHALIDGVIIGVGFQVGPTVGTVTTLGLLAHEVPQGVAVASIMLHARYKPSRTLLLSGLVALATPLGTLLAVGLTSGLPDPMLGQLLGVAAGTFLYVAGADLIPASHASRQALTGVMLLAGVGLVASVLAAFHTH